MNVAVHIFPKSGGIRKSPVSGNGSNKPNSGLTDMFVYKKCF